MGAGVKAAEHGRYTTPTDDVRRRHGLLPPRTGLIYRIMMAHGGVPHSHGELIHRSAWNRNSAKFICRMLHSPGPIDPGSPQQAPRHGIAACILLPRWIDMRDCGDGGILHSRFSPRGLATLLQGRPFASVPRTRGRGSD